MGSEVAYMLGVVVAGFAVNFGLRALPFVLFGSRRGELPSWVDRAGKIISPVVIAGLIVYAYSGLAWRAPGPYVAGAVVVLLHLWRRNAMLSILVGTACYMGIPAALARLAWAALCGGAGAGA